MATVYRLLCLPNVPAITIQYNTVSYSKIRYIQYHTRSFPPISFQINMALLVRVVMMLMLAVPLCTAQYQQKSDLGFWVTTEQKAIFAAENSEVLCLQTNVLSGTQEQLKATITSITATLSLMKQNKVFKAKAESDDVKRIIRIIDIVAFQITYLQGQITDLDNYLGNDEATVSWKCDIEWERPAAPIHTTLSIIKETVEAAWRVVASKAKTGASKTDMTYLMTSLDIDTKIILNMIPRTFEQLESTVTTHESLLQLEISEDLLVYLNDQVPELQQVIREDFQVIGCTQNQKGFYCKIIIRQEDTGNIGYQLGAVPFMYDGTIYTLDLNSALIDPSHSFVSPTCTPISNDYGCTDVKWMTNTCLNAINRENFAEVGQNCQFRPEVPQDYYVLQDHLGALVIGPVDQGLVVFINDEKRILDFPVRICGEGKIRIANNENVQDFDVSCKGQVISTFRYNHTIMDEIFKHNTWWPAIHDFIPENAEDILVALSAMVNVLSIMIGLIVLCSCCQRRGLCKQTNHNFAAFFSRKQIIPTAPLETGCNLEMQPLSEQNAVQAAVTKKYAGRSKAH